GAVSGLERAGGTEMPAPAILAVKQRHALISGVGDDDPESLPGASRGGSFRFWHLLCRGAGYGGFRQVGRAGSDPLAGRGYVIVGWVTLLDLGAQFEAPIA